MSIYGVAFAAPPYHRGEDDVREFAESMPMHATFPGFHAVLARASDDDFTGFAFVHGLAPGQWWFEHVASQAPSAIRSALRRGTFLLTQLTARPEHRGRGIGGRLHDSLLATEPHRSAALSTGQGSTSARRHYDRRGWRTLLDHVRFPGIAAPYLVLARGDLAVLADLAGASS